jgi:hypothetical protein
MGTPRLVVLPMLAMLVGCGAGGEGSGACTEIGCQPASAQVQIAGLPSTPAVVELCAGETCTTVRGSRRRLGRVVVDLPETAGEEVRVQIAVRDGGNVIARDAALIPVQELRPNGPDCPPVCRFARGRLDLDTGELLPSGANPN